MAFKSACTPAPQEESEPAMVRTGGGGDISPPVNGQRVATSRSLRRIGNKECLLLRRTFFSVAFLCHAMDDPREIRNVTVYIQVLIFGLPLRLIQPADFI